MFLARILLLVTLVALSGPGQAATVRELGAAELRQAVGSGTVLSPKRVIDAVVRANGGEPIEARAFDAGGLYYRIVLKKPDGAIVSVIIDASTGTEVPKDSAIGTEVSAAAEKGAKSKGKSATAGSNGKANGKGNGNGNGGGNGNGNGNGGGNGGGNGNGNGNGKN